jgi:formyl-CoA transferase
MRPLEDTSVLDVTQVVAGSFCSLQLADLGADVLKVERVNGGDIGRSNPPFVGGRSAYFSSVNRNKKSIALDLKSDEGREAFLRLAEAADVVVENYKPETMDRFGLGYEDVRAVNEEIVYCSISGFGQTGPYADHPALDIVAQAMAGTASITGPSDGKPYRAGIPIADVAGAMYGAQSVLAALRQRDKTGEGQHLDVSMTDGMISWLTVRAGWTFGNEQAYPRMGNRLDEFVPYGIFECADGYLALAVVQDHHWHRLCEALDRPDLAADERFETTDGRRTHREELEDELEATFAECSVQTWFDRITDRDVPAAPVYDTLELWDDEHVQARGLLTTVDAGEQSIEAIDHPVAFSESSTGIRRGVADLGEHTRNELRAVGYTDAEIDELLESDAAGEP